MTRYPLPAAGAVAVCLCLGLGFVSTARGQAQESDVPGVRAWTTEQDGVSVTTYVTGDASSGTTTPTPVPKVSLGAGALYHSDRIEPDTAARTARFLVERRLIQTKDNLMLDKLADEYVLFVPVTQERPGDPHALDQYRQTAVLLSREVFGGQPVRITLTDRTRDNLMDSVTSR